VVALHLLETQLAALDLDVQFFDGGFGLSY